MRRLSWIIRMGLESHHKCLYERASEHAPPFLRDWQSCLLEGAPRATPTLLGGGPGHTEPLGNARHLMGSEVGEHG